jgi:hypothetical protein
MLHKVLILLVFCSLASCSSCNPTNYPKLPNQDVAISAIWKFYKAKRVPPKIQWKFQKDLNCKYGSSAPTNEAIGWFEILNGQPTCIAGIYIPNRDLIISAYRNTDKVVCDGALVHELLHAADFNKYGFNPLPLHEPWWLASAEEGRVACRAALQSL